MLSTTNPSKFRQYVEQTATEASTLVAQRVAHTYRQMHTYQCVDFVRQQHERWLHFDHDRLTIYQALEALNAVVDESDPDVDVPNIYHAFQTAEGDTRKAYPEQDWFHLIGSRFMIAARSLALVQ